MQRAALDLEAHVTVLLAVERLREVVHFAGGQRRARRRSRWDFEVYAQLLAQQVRYGARARQPHCGLVIRQCQLQLPQSSCLSQQVLQPKAYSNLKIDPENLPALLLIFLLHKNLLVFAVLDLE